MRVTQSQWGRMLPSIKGTHLLILKCFAQKINEKPQVIADYECGKAIPNNQIMGKIERAIGKEDVEFSRRYLCV